MSVSRTRRQITVPWYENPEPSDITINYGPDASLIFKGHRLDLRSSSSAWQWRHGEATGDEIILTDEYPDALESFFEFCYVGFYTHETTGNALDRAKGQYLHAVRVLAVAERYECEKLIKFVLESITSMWEGNFCYRETSVLFKFMIGVAYQHHDQLDFACKHGYTGKQDAQVGKIDTSKVDDFDDKDLEAADLGRYSDCAEVRLRALLVSFVDQLRLDDAEECGRRHIAVLAKQIPEFGADIAAHDLCVLVKGQ